ncbi:MAG: protease modulator HflC [Gammaproteobacteria bacterium]|nr:protease modulator HflC [Gammaproteobacteria bacterium]
MGQKNLLSIIAVLAVLVIIFSSVYTVGEKEQAVVLAFRKISRVVTEPGLHSKLPWENVEKFDRRLLTLDSAPERVLTGEKKNVTVNYFAKWRICDLKEFYVTFREGNVFNANQQLADVINSQLQIEFNKSTIEKVVSIERDTIMRNLTDETNKKVRKYGIQVVDVRIKQIELEGEVLTSVYQRMNAERETVARGLRAEGEKRARIIRAEADRKAVEIQAEAGKRSERIRGEGEAQATRIYAAAYNQDQEFYAFFRSLQGYRNAFASKDDVIILEPDSEFFKYFNASK